MLNKTQETIERFEKEIELLECLMQEALNEGEDVSEYKDALLNIETKIWRLNKW